MRLRDPDPTDAERAVICGLFQEPELIDPLMSILVAEDFSESLLASIYGLAAKMRSRGVLPANRLLLGEYAETIGFNDGDIAYLAKSVVDYTPTPSHTVHYARKILERSVQCHAEDCLQKVRASEDVDGTLNESTEALHGAQVRLARARGAVETVESTASRAAANYLDGLGDTGRAGVPGCLAGFDEWIGGPIVRGSLVIIGALPGNGKTLWMLQSLLRAAKAGHRCVMFSQEMSEDAIGERIVSMLAGVKREDIKQEDIRSIKADVVDQLRGQDVVLRTVRPTAGVICSAMEREATENGSTVFAIDYLQLLKGQGKSRYEQITNVCSEVKATTSRLGCVTYLASQLNREAVKDKGPPIPRAHYLRDSGQIEADADALLGLRYPIKDTRRDDLAADLEEDSKPFTAETYYEVYCWKLRNRTLPQGKYECALEQTPLRFSETFVQPHDFGKYGGF